MRPYTDKDYDYLYKSILSEGFTKDEMSFETDRTFITDEGFFSYRTDGKYPRLVHYFVDKDKRSFRAAHKLFRAFVKVMRENNYLFYIVQEPKGKPYLKKFIEYIKGKEYCKVDGDIYFYVPVFGRFI